MTKLTIFAIFSILSFFWLGCSSTEKFDSNTPEGAYSLAEQLEKDERYEESVQKYAEVKNKFPYSKLATESELRIADVQFKRESYIEAQSAYQLFKDFHPKHPRIDYVTFQLAMSFFNQLPSTTDRDLSVADKAILYFEEVISSFPKSENVAEAKKKKEEALRMLADKEMYIARFYLKREKYESALRRYENIIKNFAGAGLDAAALFGAAFCAFELGEKDKGQLHLKNLNNQFPSSDEAKRARSEFVKYGSN